MATLNERGHEILDPNPIAAPVHFRRPETLQETMRRFLRQESIRMQLEAEGYETEEEADDFDIDDDPPDPLSQWEHDFYAPPAPQEPPKEVPAPQPPPKEEAEPDPSTHT